ncbi:MAG TPA: hypothetical protein VI895_03080 [Bdellovibrionota bacterium]|nr:hypothetical protein [Bdellovibrionota bacterium]
MQRRILAIYFPKSPDPASLPELAEKLLAFSPRLGIRPPDLVYIDVTASTRLFDGESNLLSRLSRWLSERQIQAHVSLADNLAAAGALARSRTMKPILAPSGEIASLLSPLSIESLRFLVNPLSPPTPAETDAASRAIQVLTLLGLRTLGDFARLPASTIGSRFGPLGVDLHRRARGIDELPLRPFEPSVTYRESHSFESSVGSLEPILFVAKTLLEKLERRLQKDLNAALELVLYIETEDCVETELSVPLSRPLRRSKGLLQIVRERLSRLTLQAPIVSFAVELSLPIRKRPTQFHLFDANVADQQESLAELLGRLVAGLGPNVISAAALRERYRPEFSWNPVPFQPEQNSSPPPPPATLPLRPLLLLSPPEPLEVERRENSFFLRSKKERYAVLSLAGPERLAGEWWSGDAYARDYFVAEAEGGQRLWIFQNLPDQRFFLHGYFD